MSSLKINISKSYSMMQIIVLKVTQLDDNLRMFFPFSLAQNKFGNLNVKRSFGNETQKT